MGAHGRFVRKTSALGGGAQTASPPPPPERCTRCSKTAKKGAFGQSALFGAPRTSRITAPQTQGPQKQRFWALSARCSGERKTRAAGPPPPAPALAQLRAVLGGKPPAPRPLARCARTTAAGARSGASAAPRAGGLRHGRQARRAAGRVNRGPTRTSYACTARAFVEHPNWVPSTRNARNAQKPPEKGPFLGHFSGAYMKGTGERTKTPKNRPENGCFYASTPQGLRGAQQNPVFGPSQRVRTSCTLRQQLSIRGAQTRAPSTRKRTPKSTRPVSTLCRTGSKRPKNRLAQGAQRAPRK